METQAFHTWDGAVPLAWRSFILLAGSVLIDVALSINDGCTTPTALFFFFYPHSCIYTLEDTDILMVICLEAHTPALKRSPI